LFDLAGQKHPCERHQLVLDSLGEAPERVYSTLLSLLDGAGWKLEKMSDALTASSGSSLGRHLEESLIQSQEHAARLFRAAHKTLIRLLRNSATVGDTEDDRAPPDTVQEPGPPGIRIRRRRFAFVAGEQTISTCYPSQIESVVASMTTCRALP